MFVFFVLGLILGARAADIEMEIFGFSLAAFSMVFLFRQVKRHYDEADTARQAAPVVSRDV